MRARLIFITIIGMTAMTLAWGATKAGAQVTCFPPSICTGTASSNTTFQLNGQVFDSLSNETVNISALLHVLVIVSIASTGDTLSGATNIQSSTAIGANTGTHYLAVGGTHFPPSPNFPPSPQDIPVLLDLYAPGTGIAGLAPLIIWQRITVNTAGQLTDYQAKFGTSTLCDPFITDCGP